MTDLIDVRCTDTGTWTVQPAGDVDALSSHDSETRAEMAALEHAAEHGQRVLIHDRDQRVHDCPASADRAHGGGEPPMKS
jgi:hypothetical protein